MKPAVLFVSVLFLAAFLANAQEKLPDKQEAKALYDQALELFHQSLGDESLERTLELLHKSAEFDPESEDTWIRIAWVYWLMGDNMPKDAENAKERKEELYNKGADAGEKALALNKRSIGGLYWYTVNEAAAAEMRGILSSFNMAGVIFANMNRVDRRDPYYHYGATRRFGSEVLIRIPAWLTARFGYNPDYIVEDLQWNIERWPDYFTNYTYLAKVYVWLDEEEKALELLDYVLSHDPEKLYQARAENRMEQDRARRMWKELTGKDYGKR